MLEKDKEISYKFTADEFAMMMFGLAGARLYLDNNIKELELLTTTMGKKRCDTAYHKIDKLYRKMLAGKTVEEWCEVH